MTCGEGFFIETAPILNCTNFVGETTGEAILAELGPRSNQRITVGPCLQSLLRQWIGVKIVSDHVLNRLVATRHEPDADLGMNLDEELRQAERALIAVRKRVDLLKQLIELQTRTPSPPAPEQSGG